MGLGRNLTEWLREKEFEITYLQDSYLFSCSLYLARVSQCAPVASSEARYFSYSELSSCCNRILSISTLFPRLCWYSLFLHKPFIFSGIFFSCPQQLAFFVVMRIKKKYHLLSQFRHFFFFLSGEIISLISNHFSLCCLTTFRILHNILIQFREVPFHFSHAFR